MIKADPDLIREMIRKGRRLDNRQYDEYRSVVIEPGIVSSAEGSARVRIGNTEVVAGVKMDIGEPFPDKPGEGVLIVSAEFVPLASPEFESGPPGEDSIEVARVVDRAIRESKSIDVEKLCLKKGEKVWNVFVDIDVLNNDGNLIDASGIAAVVALINTKVPELDKEEKPVYDKKGSKKLPMKGIPLSTTIAKIDERLLTDPLLAEEEAMDARLTIGTINEGNEVQLCSMQKGGKVGLSVEEIDQIIAIAEKKSQEIRKMIK
jgi:exosome complex component RRP42